MCFFFVLYYITSLKHQSRKRNAVIKAVVNTDEVCWPRGVFFAGYRWDFLFLFDQFRLKPLLKHANKTKSREDCCSVPVTCMTAVFRFF